VHICVFSKPHGLQRSFFWDFENPLSLSAGCRSTVTGAMAGAGRLTRTDAHSRHHRRKDHQPWKTIDLRRRRSRKDAERFNPAGLMLRNNHAERMTRQHAGRHRESTGR